MSFGRINSINMPFGISGTLMQVLVYSIGLDLDGRTFWFIAVMQLLALSVTSWISSKEVLV